LPSLDIRDIVAEQIGSVNNYNLYNDEVETGHFELKPGKYKLSVIYGDVKKM
jgi:hypothetical protein